MPNQKRQILIISSGIFHVGGVIAGVNQLVLRSISEAGFQVEILSLLENRAEIKPGYIDPLQVSYRLFHGNKFAFAYVA